MQELWSECRQLHWKDCALSFGSLVIPMQLLMSQARLVLLAVTDARAPLVTKAMHGAAGRPVWMGASDPPR